MAAMRRRTLLIVIAVAAAVGGFAIASVAERIRGDDEASSASTAAGPQTKTLDWREAMGPAGERLVFGVTRFQVLANGWRARVSVTNDSSVAFEIDKAHRSFGLMLFATGKHEELTQRNADGTLPAIRAALEYEPALPQVLEPNTTWTGEISAQGALAAGSWVRVVFGIFEPIGRAPDALNSPLEWITDNAYRLRR
jgi:hypothetical protein